MGGRQVLTEPGVRPDLRSFLRGLRVCRRREAREQLPAAAALQERHERPGDRHTGPGRARRNAARAFRSRRKRRNWIYAGPQNQMYQTEHDELFASIRNGKPINNGEYMAKSTLLAIMGRMAAYTGQEITWEMAHELQGKPQSEPVRLGRPAPRRADRRAGPDAVRLSQWCSRHRLVGRKSADRVAFREEMSMHLDTSTTR